MHVLVPATLLSFLFLVAFVEAGPDGNPMPYCLPLLEHLTSKQVALHEIRSGSQSLQSADSYLGQVQLARVVPSSPEAVHSPELKDLHTWKNDDHTKLLQLLQNAWRFNGGSPTAAATLAQSCLGARLSPGGFAGRPVVSILLNYFKRPHVVSRIARDMREACVSAGVPCELVVNVDNPQEAYAWAAEAAAEGAPGFVVPVFSANLHEARGYNRAARLARGRILVIWQDDQLPSRDGAWLADTLRVFDAHPLLAILGLNTYRLCRGKERTNRVGRSAWEPDPATGVPWTYVQLADFAPMAIRAAAFWELGGLDEGWSRRGDCGIMGDWELCARAWVGGWQVGHMNIPGGREDSLGPGGTHIPTSAEACWGRQAHVGRSVLDMRYIRGASIFQDMCERAWALNMLSFRLPTPDDCPYDSLETHWGNCTAPPPEERAALATALQLPERW